MPFALWGFFIGAERKRIGCERNYSQTFEEFPLIIWHVGQLFASEDESQF